MTKKTRRPRFAAKGAPTGPESPNLGLAMERAMKRHRPTAPRASTGGYRKRIARG